MISYGTKTHEKAGRYINFVDCEEQAGSLYLHSMSVSERHTHIYIYIPATCYAFTNYDFIF